MTFWASKLKGVTRSTPLFLLPVLLIGRIHRHAVKSFLTLFMTCYRFKRRWKETLCDLISHSGVLIPLDMHWETAVFLIAESDQRSYSLREIRVFLPGFIRLQRLHTVINAVCTVHIFIILMAVGSLKSIINQMCLHVRLCPVGLRVMFAVFPGSDK